MFAIEFKKQNAWEFERVIRLFDNFDEAIEAARVWRKAALLLAGDITETRIVRIDPDQGITVMPELRREKPGTYCDCGECPAWEVVQWPAK